MKKKLIIWIAVACVILIAASLFASGVLNPKVYLRITNQSDGDLYSFWMYYSFQGKTFPDTELAKGLSKPTGNVGDNSCLPFVIGESVKTVMETNPNYSVTKPEKLTIELYVHDRPILTAEDQSFENGVKVGEALTIPIKLGKCSNIVITGNRENGFKMEFTGFSNWLIE